MTTVIFYVLSAVILVSALLAVSLRNIFHCALFLVLSVFGIAGVFLYLGAEFLAIVQVLVYVGAVTILIIFGIMLTRNAMDANVKVMNRQVFLSLVTALALGVITVGAISRSGLCDRTNMTMVVAQGADTTTETDNFFSKSNIYRLGPELIQPNKGYAFAFEFVSILVLSALIGAIVVARKDPS